MRYLKTFESAMDFNPTDVISKYWEVDFELLKDMLLSLGMTHGTHGFEIVFYLNLNGENCSVIRYEDRFKKGPWWDNLEDIIEGAERGHNRVEPKIEFWVDMPYDFDGDGFSKDLEDFISDSGMAYHSSGVIELSEQFFFALRYEGKTEMYQNLNESSNSDPEALLAEYWNVDPQEFRDIVSGVMEDSGEFDYELEFSISYKYGKHHLFKFVNGKPAWNDKIFYDKQVYLDLMRDQRKDVDFYISISIPIDRDYKNDEYVRGIAREFAERLKAYGSDWRPKDISDIVRGGQSYTQIGFLETPHLPRLKACGSVREFESMRYLKTFESHSSDDVLIIVDVQKSFKKFFTDRYVDELKGYCRNFGRVYQIWDNHVEGKNVDKDYLYDEDPDMPVNSDLYHFPNQADLIEKRYNYDVDADFYRKILDESVYKEISAKEDEGSLVRGDNFPTKEGTIIIYIGNNHKWYHMPKRLHELFQELNQAQSLNESSSVDEVVLVGGADRECLDDVETAAGVMGVRLKRNGRYVYSATHCPIK